MRNNIKEKLQNILRKEIFEETDVIYILSRIRKLLEIDERKKDFKVLNFYCNWALHAQIEDVDSISKTLQKPGENAISISHLFIDFDKDLKKFLENHNIQTNIFDDRKALIKFHNLLTDIYTDTPLILKTISKKKITFHKGERFGENSGFFSTTYEEL